MSAPIGPPAADLPPPVVGATPPRHVSPVTPLVQAGQAAAVTVVIALAMGQEAIADLGGWLLPAIVLLFGIIVLVVGGFSYLAWRNLTYWFDDDGDFRMSSGVLTRQERRLQLSRLQSVDVQQPLLARIFGLGVVNVEVAGSGDSRASVQYLPLAQAEALRAEVLARAAGLRPDTASAPEQVLLTVPGRQLAISLLLRGVTVALAGLTVLIVVTTVATSGPMGLFTLLFVGLPLLAVVGEFFSFYGFTVARSPDGLRTRSGLLSTRSQTIPPGRVHAVEFVQSLLWRRHGWVRVRLNVAGLRRDDDDNGGVNTSSVLLPVASWAQAHEILRLVMPGVDLESMPWDAAPPRSAKRAWLQHRNLAYATDERVFATRSGRFVLRIAAIPHARVQSVRVTQGPWERALGLATMHADSVPGPVAIRALYRPALQARTIAETEHAAMMATERDPEPLKWMLAPPPEVR